jgi:hypothetical protein
MFWILLLNIGEKVKSYLGILSVVILRLFKELENMYSAKVFYIQI